MNNLYQSASVEEVIARIDQLQPASQRQWGKMDVAQMLAHCSAALEMASGKFVAKRSLLGRIVGPRVRHILVEDKPFSHNSPSSKELKVVDQREFAREKDRLVRCIQEFHQGGESRCTTNPHPFFGPITPLEWSTGMYKHIDHHLKQFGA